jgi:hypothetical protein
MHRSLQQRGWQRMVHAIQRGKKNKVAEGGRTVVQVDEARGPGLALHDDVA